MAKSLFEKLGLLVRSSVTDFVAEVGDRLPDLTLPRTGELDYEVDALRKRVNEALDYEDKLAADLAKLLGEIEETDVAADRAVAEGDNARARLLVMRLKRLQNRAAMLEHQLQQHRAAAAELMSQVNYLDSLVGDIEGRRQVERAQQAAQETEPPAAEVEAPRVRLERPAPTQVEPPAPPRTVRIPVTGEEDAAPAPSPSEASAPPPASEAPASEAAPAPPRQTPPRRSQSATACRPTCVNLSLRRRPRLLPTKRPRTRSPRSRRSSGSRRRSAERGSRSNKPSKTWALRRPGRRNRSRGSRRCPKFRTTVPARMRSPRTLPRAARASASRNRLVVHLFTLSIRRRTVVCFFRNLPTEVGD
ncbi:MAG: hypothetical protein M5R40_08055 [Anaerolineae bacterium]|nr:hypothetical protein [Anaerolineae bacterium]